MKTLHKILVLGISAMVFGTCAIAQATDKPGYTLSIAPQPLDTALTQLATQSGVQLAFYPPDCEGLSAPRLEGRYTLQAALQHLLANTPLRYELLNERMVAIRLKEGATSSSQSSSGLVKDLGRVRLAQGQVAAGGYEKENPQVQPVSESRPAIDNADKELVRSRNDEVVVTGTQIRGAAPVGSQVLVFTKEQIERTGAATPQQFLATLPQNFGGDFSDDSFTSPALPGFDPSYGSGVNLRGLGATSTLVLMNGRRLASAGQASYTDISMIPLSAVERIEVLTDGASAIYGSDAIGGVVNFIMRSNYSAAETQLRGAISDDSDAEEFQGAQSIGRAWNSGSVLVNLEFYRRGSVNALDRDFSAAGGDPYDLIPEQKRTSASLSAKQSIAPEIELFADVLYSERDAAVNSWDAFSVSPIWVDSDTRSVGGTVGLMVGIGSWSLTADGNIGRVEIDERQDEELFVLSTTSNVSTLRSANILLSGPLFALPAGQAKLAVGGSYREEEFDFEFGAITPPENSFNTRALFMEVAIPLLKARDDDKKRLQLSLAGRYEDYSNFGETFDPKVGVEWSPSQSMKVRASWGTSFKAPSLYQLNEWNSLYFITTAPGTNSILMFGNSADLHEETSTSWTVGMEFAPDSWSGFQTQLNYFDTKYNDRIAFPDSGLFSTILSRFRSAGLAVQRGDIPNAEFDSLVADRLARPVGNWFGCNSVDPNTGICLDPSSSINALIDARITNLAESRTRGIDFLVSQRIAPRMGDVEVSLNANYIIDYQQRLSSTAPLIELVDRPYQPLKLRMRASTAWSFQNWSAAVFVNYTDNYANTFVVPEGHIESWTTIDLNARYSFSNTWLSGTSLTLGIQNALNAEPPVFPNPNVLAGSPRIGYDPANADPIGRVWSLAVMKKW